MAEEKKNIQIQQDDIYDAPAEANAFIDANKNEIVDDLSPWEKIKLVAEQNNIKIKDPKKNCNRPGCYGRGYTGLIKDSHTPVPCKCIFDPEDWRKLNDGLYINNYRTRRRFKILSKRKSYIKQALKDKRKEDKRIKKDLVKLGTEMAIKKKEKLTKEKKNGKDKAK